MVLSGVFVRRNVHRIKLFKGIVFESSIYIYAGSGSPLLTVVEANWKVFVLIRWVVDRSSVKWN